MNGLQPIALERCEKFGLGVARPEDVAVSASGAVWVSDKTSACAHVHASGIHERSGSAGGAPNGINFDRHGRIVIANFGGPDDGFGPLQRLDPTTGEIELLVGEINNRKLFGCNYPIIDSHDRIWCSHSTFGPLDRAFDHANDGSIFRYDPDGSVHVVAEGIAFTNGLALDENEAFIYACETTGCDVVRFPILPDATLGPLARHGPKLGYAHDEVQHLRPLSLETRSQLGATDGCGFDQRGNLWVTLVMANKIVAITPDGDVVTVLSDPEGKLMRNPTNVTWGGDDLTDLYIGSVTTDYVLHAKSPVPGMPLVHQQ